jgi:surface polysaccharide O-acyltransferase-like enzyme
VAAGSSSPQGERWFELDLLRALAILAVIFIHSSAWVVPTTAPAYTGLIAALVGLSRFSVPAFVLASGLVLYRRYGDGVPAGRFLRRRWSRVVAPWLCWAPVLGALHYARGDFESLDDARAWLLHGGGLYFLVLIAQLYLLFLVVAHLRIGRRGLLVLAALAVAVQLGLGSWRTYGALPRQGPLAWLWTRLAYEEAPFYVGYFALGCLAGAEWESIRGWWRCWPAALAAALVSMALFVAESFTVAPGAARHETNVFIWPATLPLTTSVALLVLWSAHVLRHHAAWSIPVGSWLGRRSLGLYIVHPLALRLLGPHLGWLPDWPTILLLVSGSLALAALAVAALRSTPWTAASIGERPRAGRLSLLGQAR